MPAFRILDPFPAYTNNNNAPVSGGQLRFFETNSTTPKTVWGDKAKTISLGSTVTLDSSGRTNSDVWGDGAYRVALHDALGVKIDEADNVEIDGGTATALPALVSGRFLTSDGVVLSWASIRQLPDPTGNADKVLSTDGTVFTWIPKPTNGTNGAPGAASVAGDATSLTFTGGAAKMALKTGSGTLPASGGRTSSVSITFGGTAYSANPLHIGATPNLAVVTGVGYSAVLSAINITATGCTINADVNSSQSGANINVPIPFTWMALGVVP